MNRKAKIAIYCAIGVIAILGVVWANYARLNSQIRGIEVEIDYGGFPALVTDDDVRTLLQHKMPHLSSQIVKEVDTEKVRKAVATSPYLYQPNVEVSVGRNVIVRAHQRRPVAKVFDNDSVFYIDSVASKIPLSEHADPDILIANGQFAGKKHNLSNVSAVATFISNNEDYKNLFDQVYEDDIHDIYLVPKLGSHVVLLGDTTNLDTKFSNLMAMYQRGMKKTGWDTYALVNLKYEGQVICRKR